MSKWKTPPGIKIYEALGAIADGRVIAKKVGKFWVYSSSGRKHYDVQFSQMQNAITSNDNGSYWQSYLGYPAVAVLMQIGIIHFPKDLSLGLAGIEWKKINTKYKNDFELTEKYVLEYLVERGFQIEDVKLEIENITARIIELGLDKFGPTKKPPEGY